MSSKTSTESLVKLENDGESHESPKEEVQTCLQIKSPVAFREKIKLYEYVATSTSRPVTRSRSAIIKNKDTQSQSADLEDISVPPSKRRRTSGATSTCSVASSKKSQAGLLKPKRGDSPNQSPARRLSSKYAAPSRYAHLNALVDILSDNLLLVFVGVNPGISTAVAGHAYAHPSNRFWHLLHTSGLTPERKLSPIEDRNLPQLYSYGNTNIVERPTRDQGELSKEEMVAGTAILEEKFRRFKPEAICIVGKGIWEAVWRNRHGRNITKSEFHYGWQDEAENMGLSDTVEEADIEGQPWTGTRIFVATSTSGQAAFLRPEEKLAIWQPLGKWAQRRRKERASKGLHVGSARIIGEDEC